MAGCSPPPLRVVYIYYIAKLHGNMQASPSIPLSHYRIQFLYIELIRVRQTPRQDAGLPLPCTQFLYKAHTEEADSMPECKAISMVECKPASLPYTASI